MLTITIYPINTSTYRKHTLSCNSISFNSTSILLHWSIVGRLDHVIDTLIDCGVLFTVSGMTITIPHQDKLDIQISNNS